MVWTRKFTVLFVLGVAVLVLAVWGMLVLFGTLSCSPSLAAELRRDTETCDFYRSITPGR